MVNTSESATRLLGVGSPLGSLFYEKLPHKGSVADCSRFSGGVFAGCCRRIAAGHSALSVANVAKKFVASTIFDKTQRTNEDRVRQKAFFYYLSNTRSFHNE